MTKKANKVEEVIVTETTKRVSTNELLKSDNAADKISGVARVLGECYVGRSKEKKQSIVNKVSKATLSLRAGEISDDKIEEAKALVNKSWKNIKECMIDEKKDLSKDSLALYELIISFGKKSPAAFLPDEITF